MKLWYVEELGQLYQLQEGKTNLYQTIFIFKRTCYSRSCILIELFNVN